jgi:hypothetical protein
VQNLKNAGIGPTRRAGAEGARASAMKVLVDSAVRISDVVLETVSTTIAVMVENVVTTTKGLVETVVKAVVVDVELIALEIGGWLQ